MITILPPIFALTIFLAILIAMNSESDRMNRDVSNRAEAATLQLAQLDRIIDANQADFDAFPDNNSPQSIVDVTDYFEMPYPFEARDDIRFIRTRTATSDDHSGRTHLIVVIPTEQNISHENIPPQTARMMRRIDREMTGSFVDSGVIGSVETDGGNRRTVGSIRFQHMRDWLQTGDIAFAKEI